MRQIMYKITNEVELAGCYVPLDRSYKRKSQRMQYPSKICGKITSQRRPHLDYRSVKYCSTMTKVCLKPEYTQLLKLMKKIKERHHTPNMPK